MSVVRSRAHDATATTSRANWSGAALIPAIAVGDWIVEAICTGRQPAALTAERLKLYGQLSFGWNTQQQQHSL